MKMAETAWNADLRSAQRAEGPRAARRYSPWVTEVRERPIRPVAPRENHPAGRRPAVRCAVAQRVADQRSAFQAGGAITAVDRPAGLHFHSNWPPVGTRGAPHRARRNADRPDTALLSVQLSRLDVSRPLSPQADNGTSFPGLRPAVPTGGRRSKPYAPSPRRAPRVPVRTGVPCPAYHPGGDDARPKRVPGRLRGDRFPRYLHEGGAVGPLRPDARTWGLPVGWRKPTAPGSGR